jgi:DNA-binding IclR family transcriptional regulator
MSEKTDRQFIGALGKGLKVLRAFKPGDPPLSNLELAGRTGFPRPTISRITYTLTELGYLTYQEQLGHYELGSAALMLGHVARTNFDAIREIKPVMERLAEFTGSNIGLGTRERSNMVYVEACQGPSLVGLRLDVGSRVPILSSAMGRAYIAATTPEERARAIKQIRRDGNVDEGRIKKEVEQACKDYEQYGFCVSIGDWHRDIHGVAVPVPTPELSRLYIINCGGPAYLLPRNRIISEIGPELLHAVNDIRLPFRDTSHPKTSAEAPQDARPPALKRKARAGKAAIS